MFGHSDDQQAMMGSPTVQNPSMLDNVSHTDFQTADDQAAAATPDPTPFPADPVPQLSSLDPSLPPAGSIQATPVVEHPITTDNPFAQDPLAQSATTDQPTSDAAATQQPVEPPAQDSTALSASGPVEPPVVPEEHAEQHAYIDALTEDDETEHAASESTEASEEATSASTEPEVEAKSEAPAEEAATPAFSFAPLDTTPAATDDGVPPVNLDKLAEMKKQALTHLEPLADKLDGTPEETFKTTMMMIQANDNHTLLEKALKAAREIKDDKQRAQAMLDIINEINYFSQGQ